MKKTGISWTRNTLNVSYGCSRVSEGCRYCYAVDVSAMLARIAGQAIVEGRDSGKAGHALKVLNGARTNWNNELVLVPDSFKEPLSVKQPALWFVNSLSDICHEKIPDEFIIRGINWLSQAHWHQFQLLTKRAARLAELAPRINWPPNVWMGVSVEDQKAAVRIDHLRKVPAAIRFLSVEPLIGPIENLDLSGIHWVICGGESGPNARRCDAAWVRQVRDACVRQSVPFFMKQWGTFESNPDQFDITAKERGGHAKGGCLIDKYLWDQLPEGVDHALRMGIYEPDETNNPVTTQPCGGAL